jgi:hypothetical protein
MSESSQDAFDRGHLAGEIAARLAGHDQHFAAINGSLDKIAAGLASQTLAIQALADQARADAVTRVATATALKDAEEARRDKGDQSWTPFQRAFAVVAAVAAGVVIWATLFRHR